MAERSARATAGDPGAVAGRWPRATGRGRRPGAVEGRLELGAVGQQRHPAGESAALQPVARSGPGGQTTIEARPARSSRRSALSTECGARGVLVLADGDVAQVEHEPAGQRGGALQAGLQARGGRQIEVAAQGDDPRVAHRDVRERQRWVSPLGARRGGIRGDGEGNGGDGRRSIRSAWQSRSRMRDLTLGPGRQRHGFLACGDAFDSARNLRGREAVLDDGELRV